MSEAKKADTTLELIIRVIPLQQFFMKPEILLCHHKRIQRSAFGGLGVTMWTGKVELTDKKGTTRGCLRNHRISQDCISNTTSPEGPI
jgi:hypothetical protein